MVHDTKGKVVLVTGAAGGIGEQIVRNFLQEGAKHVAILDVATTSGAALEAELNSKYGAGKAKFFKCDVTDDEHLFNAFDVTIAEQGCIDLVVNNAGIMNDSKEVYKKQIAVNVTAVITGTIKAIEVMRKDKGGKGGTVINISSIAALIQWSDLPIYCATKSAVIQFSNCIGMEGNFQRTGVRVVTVCFGVTDTTLFAPNKLGTMNSDKAQGLVEKIEALPSQLPESAALGVVDAYKQGRSGSTWLVHLGKPAEDISQNIQDAYSIMSTQMRAT